MTEIKRHKKIRHDLTGEKFGNLTCLNPTGNFKNCAREWACICDCGNKCTATANHLVSGNRTSCGCLRKSINNQNPRWKGFGEISGRYYSDLKRGAKYRKLDFNVSLEYIWNLFLKQNRKCALSGEEIKFSKTIKDKKLHQTASLDRIDPKIGYIEGNIQWIHQDINFMKQDMTEQELYNWCRKIVNHKLTSQ